MWLKVAWPSWTMQPQERLNKALEVFTRAPAFPITCLNPISHWWGGILDRTFWCCCWSVCNVLYLSLKRSEKEFLFSNFSEAFWQCFVSAFIVALMLADASASRHSSTSPKLSPCRLAWHCLMLVTESILPPSFTWDDTWKTYKEKFTSFYNANFYWLDTVFTYFPLPLWCNGYRNCQSVCKIVVWILGRNIWEDLSLLSEILCAALEYLTLGSLFTERKDRKSIKQVCDTIAFIS